MAVHSPNDTHQAPILSASRRGFYAARRASMPASERLWPWMLVAAAIFASLAAMAR